jgi:hypothetical protein
VTTPLARPGWLPVAAPTVIAEFSTSTYTRRTLSRKARR